MNIHHLSDFPYEYETKSTDDFSTYNSDKVHDYHNMDEKAMYGESDNSTVSLNSLNMDKYDMPEETGNRYDRYFIGQQGQVWIMWAVSELPDKYDEPTMWRMGEFVPSSDGKALFIQVSLHLTRREAIEQYQAHMSTLVRFAGNDAKILTAMYELDKMDNAHVS